ncbi:MAG TPA: hypothetical protein VFL92_06555 [Sphingomonas sp.]|nr:hypothetical protein [Sphingomonas sp.]
MHRWRNTVALAALLSCSVALAGAGLRPQDDGDIVVTGERPHIEAGLWHFTLWPSHGFTGGAGHRRQMTTRGHQWDICVSDAAFETTVARFLGGDMGQIAGAICSSMRVHVAKGELAASVRCTSHSPGAGTIVASDMTRRYHGELGPTKVVVSIGTVFETDGERTGELDGKLTAERVGECPSAAPAPAAARPPIAPVTTKLVPPPAAEPAPEPETRPAPSAAPQAAPSDGQSPDDIVVVARKLRKLRLHFASDGRRFSWCHADISSGDPRLDRIGCAIVRACVEQGYDDQDSALECFDRKVATLEDDPRRPAGKQSDGR